MGLGYHLILIFNFYKRCFLNQKEEGAQRGHNKGKLFLNVTGEFLLIHQGRVLIAVLLC